MLIVYMKAVEMQVFSKSLPHWTLLFYYLLVCFCLFASKHIIISARDNGNFMFSIPIIIFVCSHNILDRIFRTLLNDSGIMGIPDLNLMFRACQWRMIMLIMIIMATVCYNGGFVYFSFHFNQFCFTYFEALLLGEYAFRIVNLVYSSL